MTLPARPGLSKPHPHPLITGDRFVAGLLALGIADNRTRKVTIEAEVGKAIEVTIEKFGDDRLLELLEDGSVVITHSEKEAIAR